MSDWTKREGMTVSVSVELEGVGPKEVFDRFVLDISDGLEREGIKFQTGPKGGVIEESVKFGRVVKWEPPTRIEIDWKTGAKWEPGDSTRLRIRLEPIQGTKKTGTRITVENDSWGKLVGDRGLMLSEWFGDEIVTNLFKATSPKRFTNWLADKRARSPTGAAARASYRDPLFHRPGFKAVLHYLKLKKEDYLLEVGCGGGAFLLDALRTGCRAAGIDHSPDMVRVARELNADAISKKRLEVVQAEADSIPYPDRTFSCAASTNVFGFIDNPVTFLSEIHRVLKRGGRLVLTTGSKESKGTIASPYPIAYLLHFYGGDELVELAKQAGFDAARVEMPDLGSFAREANLPKDVIKIFSGKNSILLLADKK
jgi:SAM-dependent methyltransferase